MLRHPLNLSILLFVISCVLLYFAFNSRHGANLPDIEFPPRIPNNDSDLAIRLDHSEALYQKSLEGRQHMVRAYENIKDDRNFPMDFVRPYNLYEFVYPAFNCPHDVERLGRIGDGGKWVCGMTRYEANKDRPCVIYSFGVNDDSSFENALLGRTNCEIWGYDYTVDSWGSQLQKEYGPRTHFERVGISGVTNETRTPPFYSVRDLMRRNGHEYIDIMKMDIEGSEFDALNAFMAEYSDAAVELPVGQLLVEIHAGEPEEGDIFTLPRNLDEWVGFWEGMEAKGLRPFWVEPNMLGNVKKNRPLYAEVSLLNRADGKGLLVN